VKRPERVNSGHKELVPEGSDSYCSLETTSYRVMFHHCDGPNDVGIRRNLYVAAEAVNTVGARDSDEHCCRRT